MPLDENDYGAYIATTDIIDPQELANLNINSQDFKKFLARLRQNINAINLLLNLKDTGLYPTTEFVCGKVYPPDPALNSSTSVQPVDRNLFRKRIELGTLPNAGIKTVAHGIAVDNNLKIVSWVGSATDPVAHVYLPLPFASTVLNNTVQIYADATNIIITTGIDRTNFTYSEVVLELLKI